MHHWTLAEEGGALRIPSSYSSPDEGIHKPSKSARTLSWPESKTPPRERLGQAIYRAPPLPRWPPKYSPEHSSDRPNPRPPAAPLASEEETPKGEMDEEASPPAFQSTRTLNWLSRPGRSEEPNALLPRRPRETQNRELRPRRGLISRCGPKTARVGRKLGKTACGCKMDGGEPRQPSYPNRREAQKEGFL